MERSSVWKRAAFVILIGSVLTTLLDETSILRHFLAQMLSMEEIGTARMSRQEGRTLTEMNSANIFVVTTTYYPDTTDIRYKLAEELCRLANRYRIHTFISDDSPQHESAQPQPFGSVKGEYVHVFRQSEEHLGKGGGLRQSIQHAIDFIGEQRPDSPQAALEESAIVFTEPEKTDLMNHLGEVTKPLLAGQMDVIVPRRKDDSFRATYPIEQYHSESFGNLHFNGLAQKFDGFKGLSIDWLFGPFAFKASLANQWLAYEGTSWDAQMIPYVRGVKQLDWKIGSVEIDFEHPGVMKAQEEGNLLWSKKRLNQLNLLFEVLGDRELTD